MEEVARRDPPSGGSPDTDDFPKKTLSGDILRTAKFIYLKIETLYQENMTIEEVARRDRRSSGSPDTDDFRKNFEWVYLEIQ